MSWAETIWLKSKIEDVLAMSKRYVSGTENDHTIFEKSIASSTGEVDLTFKPKISGYLDFEAGVAVREPVTVRATLIEDGVILSQQTTYAPVRFPAQPVVSGREYVLFLEVTDNSNDYAQKCYCQVFGNVVDVGYFDAS